MRCQSSSTDHSAGTGTAHLSRPTAVCLCPRTTAESQRFLCSRRQVTPTSTVSNVRFPTWMRLECQLTAGGPGSVLQPGCGCFKDACHMSSLVDWKQCFNSVNSAAPSDRTGRKGIFPTRSTSLRIGVRSSVLKGPREFGIAIAILCPSALLANNQQVDEMIGKSTIRWKRNSKSGVHNEQSGPCHPRDIRALASDASRCSKMQPSSSMAS